MFAIRSVRNQGHGIQNPPWGTEIVDANYSRIALITLEHHEDIARWIASIMREYIGTMPTHLEGILTKSEQ